MSRPRATALELASFTALAWFASAHWASGLVAGASGARTFACVAIAVAVGVALVLSSPVRGVRGALLRGTCVVAGAGAGLVAIGLERQLLAPGRWDDLADGLDRGLAALGSVQWPYDGPEPWAALVLLLAIPATVVAAAALAFWHRALRPVGLVLLVALYAVAVTEHRFDGELARGIALLVLIAAWLWLPRLPERGWRAGVAAAGAVLAACAVALPAAARYEQREAWVDYESWNPFAARATTSFDWSHSYGPIEWPRDGTTLMNVRSDERHYWKVETLDRFDGLRWEPSEDGGGLTPALPLDYREDWETSFRVTVRELRTDRLPVAGTARGVDADDPVRLHDDGTATVERPLDEGSSYSVRAYVPDPTPAEMRASGAPPLGLFVASTEVLLPPDGTTALDQPSDIDPYGPRIAASEEEIRRSPYAGVLRLARRLARGRQTTYDVVRAVQRHLRSEKFVYTERPPLRDFPLAAFLLEERVGYCQQFSGAMALMLRMLDIPARVVAGFTPGSYNRDTREYRVRDLDAHSWVEVWLEGIGWVPFDPTPSIAPADSQSSADAASASAAAGIGEIPDPRGAQAGPSEPAGDDAAPAEPGDATAASGWAVLAGLVALGLAALSALQVRSRRRRRAVRDPAELEVAALRRALERVGEPVPARSTLRQLEHRLERGGRAPAARYVRSLRERRYAVRGPGAPEGASRRDLRRALGRGRGVRGRLRALVALPPLSFRRG